MKSRYTGRAPALAGALCVAAACLAGCAWKNPLLDDSTAHAAAKPAAQNGVQTSKERRFLGVLSPYRPDVQQGNFVSAEWMAQLKEGMKRKEGMTREQVRFVLGTPLLADPFHGDRWDYVFRMQKGNGEIIFSRIAVFFKGNRLDHFDGTVLPTEQDYLAILAGRNATAAAPAAAESK